MVRATAAMAAASAPAGRRGFSTISSLITPAAPATRKATATAAHAGKPKEVLAT
jgi:hypothetical protein